MKRITLLTLTFIAALMAHAATRTASISIDHRVRYQNVTGFGGFTPSPTWSYWLSDAQMDQLYGKSTGQLGLNIVRLYIPNNKNVWGQTLANAKRAQKNGAIIFASPWSPPAAWKDNNDDSNGGKLLESHYEDWANFLNDYYLYLKQNGVTLYGISIQNEPDWNTTYQSCIWTGAEMAKFIRLYGHIIQCKIIAPESIHFTRSLHEPILNDEEACKNLGILGGHFYGWDGSAYPLAARKGKEVWMTEYLINERQQNEGKNIDWKTDGFLFANSINDAMLANFSAWVHYSLKRYYGVIGDGQYGTVDNQITKRGYVLSQYGKFVSNSTRIKHILNDASTKLSSSAYYSNTMDKVIIMVINPTADTYTTTLDLPFNTKTGNMLTTSETKNSALTSYKLTAETHTYEVTIEPYSVNTVQFLKSSSREDMPDDPVSTDKVVFNDDFDMYGAGCIPQGWKSVYEGGTRYAGNYSLGPRVMGFNAEGAMQYGFYFRSSTGNAGTVSYGEVTNSPLTLEPGQYTLHYSTVGWQAMPSITAGVLKGSSIVKTQASKPVSVMTTNGSSARITKTADFTIDFEVAAKGNYIIKWSIPKSSGGYAEALVGNIRLVKHETTDVEINLGLDTFTRGEIKEIHDAMGRRLPQMQKGLNIVTYENGETVKIFK